MHRLKNKKIGAKVIVPKLLIDINPKDKWKYLKNVAGTIVEKGNLKQYWYTSSGCYTHKNQMFFDPWSTSVAVKFDNDIKDIAGNNIVVFYEYDIKFVQYLSNNTKIISRKEYKKAKKLIEKYEYQQTLK